MPWWSDLATLLQDRTTQRLIMAVWLVLWTAGSGLLAGYHLDRYLMRQWDSRHPDWYPRDGAAWAGLGAGLVVALTAFR
jgi:hypothetical protein